ncbi:sensor histidine kinase [Paenibacillus sp. YYML68]|uniref:sensor histidine kinase n=1 Tax=Paenibacillus sp. YYML68 TaxID=2909250 RepID=UPI002492B508|nr:sensor histidine kinase [Paenibacillus sp. YYML68]
MRSRSGYWIIYVLLGLLMIGFLLSQASSNTDDDGVESLTEWEYVWAQSDSPHSSIFVSEQAQWQTESLDKLNSDQPSDSSVKWIRFVVPSFAASSPSLLMNRVYGQNMSVYMNGVQIYVSTRSYPYLINNVVVPLSKEAFGKTVYVRLQSSKGQLGFSEVIRYGEDHELRKRLDANLESVIIGSAFVFIAFTMLICTVFLRRTQATSQWMLLTVIVLSVGIMFITYSPYSYSIYQEHGELLFILFDCTLLSMLPAITYFFEKIIGPGYWGTIRLFRNFQLLYSLYCAVFLMMTCLHGYAAYEVYYFFSVTLLGYVIIVQFILLATSTIINAVKGNQEAHIFAIGSIMMAVSVVIDVICFYVFYADYELYLWKWGVSFFVISLIVVMGRRLAHYYEQVINYSREVELYNNQLQRSDKLEVISELAASIAHEVRNPLQVTRGFLQLLSQKVSEQERQYMHLAISELDRASDIITDFLTFAKPQLDNMVSLNVHRELKQIEGIIIPLARLNGGEIEVTIPQQLHIRGNSSKFKQALINLIKNSIEAFMENGRIEISASEENGHVRIHIKDNGEGMDAAAIARLGEPYFSTKTKGTGLGLMVTFRIIEVMQGQIEFFSEKGHGTEVVLTFPTYSEHSS